MTRVKSDGATSHSARFRCRSTCNIILRVVFAIATVGFAVESPADNFDRPQIQHAKRAASSTAKESAIRSIPLDKLTEQDRENVSKLISGSHIFRRMPIHVVPCDPQLYLFLVRHPDVVVGIWEELGISRLHMKQVGPLEYQTQESGGTVGTSKFIYQDNGTHLIWVDGVFNNPLLTQPVRGTSLLILRTGYVQESDGQSYITSRLDTFTHIDNVGIEFITRTLQPLMGKVADNNFVQTSAFVGSLSRTAEANPKGVRRLAANLQRVDPEVRKQLGLLAYQVAERSELRHAQRLAAKPVMQTATR